MECNANTTSAVKALSDQSLKYAVSCLKKNTEVEKDKSIRLWYFLSTCCHTLTHTERLSAHTGQNVAKKKSPA